MKAAYEVYKQLGVLTKDMPPYEAVTVAKEFRDLWK